MLEQFLIMAGGKQEIRIPRAHGDVGNDIGHIRRDHGLDTFRNVLITHDSVSHDDGRTTVFRALNRSQRIDDLDLACAVSATDDLPIAHVRGLAQQRIEVAKQRGERKPEAVATNDFFAEELNGPIFGVKTVPKVFGFRLEQLIKAINPGAQCAANSIGDGFRMARPFGVERGERLQASPMARAGGQFGVLVGQCDIFQYQGDEVGQLFALQFQMDVSFNDAADELFQGEIEVEQFSKSAAMGELIGETPAGFGNLSDEFDWRNVCVIPLVPDITQQALEAAIELTFGGVNGGFEIGAGMAGFENLEEIPKILEQGVFQMRKELRAAADGPLKAFEAVPSHAVVPEDLIKAILIAVRVQEFDVGLTDDDVVGRSVVVEFLMPFLQEMTAHLFDMTPAHDIDDFIADALAFAAAADSAQAQAGERARGGFAAKDVG